MSALPVVTFDPDPSRSPHARVAFGSGQDRAPLWARVTVFTGGGGGGAPARDAARMLAPVLSVEALLAAVVAEPYAAAWAQACAAVAPSPPGDVVKPCAFGPPPWAPAAAHLMGAAPHAPPRGGYGARAIQEGPAAGGVFARVRDHARRYGAHPDFRAQDPPAIARVNNYITSTYGEPLPAATLEAVRARLAAEM